MFRRPGPFGRFNRGRIAVGGSAGAAIWVPGSEASLKLFMNPELADEAYDVGTDSIANGGDTSIVTAFTQASAGNRPTVHRTCGTTSLRFVTTDSRRLVTAAFPAVIPQPFTIFGMVYPTGVATYTLSTNEVGGGTTNNAFVQLSSTTYPTAANLVMNAGSALTATAVAHRYAPLGYCCVFNGASSAFYTAGPGSSGWTLSASGNAGTKGLSGFTLGSSNTGTQYLFGAHGDWGLFGVAADATLRGHLYDYLQTRYNVSGKLVTGMMIGDSTCKSFGSTGNYTGRKYLYEDIHSVRGFFPGRNLRLVGETNDNTAFCDAEHSGITGEVCSAIETRGDADLGGTLSGVEVMIVNAILNNLIVSGEAPATAVTAFSDMCKSWHGIKNTLRYVLPTCSSVDPAHAKYADVESVKSLMPAMFTALSAFGLGVHSWDLGAIAYSGATYFDQIHPNDAGYALWVAARRAALQAAVAAVP